MVEVQGYYERAVVDLARLGVAVPAAAHGDRDRFHRAFWMAEQSSYALAVDGTGRPVRVVTSNPGHLLGTPILTPARAGAVADRLMLPDLWSIGGIRTHSRDDPHFDADSYQRGSVWPHDNWVIHEGLRAIGRHADAARLRAAVLDALCHLEHIPELFAVHGDRPVALAVAQPVQAWSSGAVVALLNAERQA
jgi:glycogen debranching enzyme